MRVEYRSNTQVLPRACTHIWVIWDLRPEKQYTDTKLMVNFVSIRQSKFGLNDFLINSFGAQCLEKSLHQNLFWNLTFVKLYLVMMIATFTHI